MFSPLECSRNFLLIVLVRLYGGIQKAYFDCRRVERWKNGDTSKRLRGGVVFAQHLELLVPKWINADFADLGLCGS
jgi:hypothetical protein